MEVFFIMQKKQHKICLECKKILFFMALLVAMQLVLTRVLVLDLGPYRITVGTYVLCLPDCGWDRLPAESADCAQIL